MAYKIQNLLGESTALLNIGCLYLSLTDYAGAIDYFQESLKIVRILENPELEGKLLNNLGYAFYLQGNLKLAENTLFEGIKASESLRGRGLKDDEKVSLFDTQHSVYRTLQQVLVAQDKTDTALEIAERGRGRAFVELLASRLFSNSKLNPTSPTITEIRRLLKLIHTL